MSAPMGDDLEIAQRLRNLASAWGGMPLLLKAADRLEQREGWRGIESIPVNTRVLVWVNEPSNRMVGVYFGSAYGLSDGTKVAKPEGCNGSGWNITHWMPLPPAPEGPANIDKSTTT